MSVTLRSKRLLAIGLPCLLLLAASVASQPRHRILNQRNRFYLENRDTRQLREFDMWSTRLANAAFDSRFTDRVIANLDDYLRYGVNTLSVGIQGGNLGSNAFNALYPAVYNANGSLKLESAVWGDLKRLLAETDKRGMVLIIQYWYFKRDQNVPAESAALEVTRRVTQWLKDTGHRNYLLDLVNEFGHTEYDNRSLFTTVTGALKLLNTVYEVDAEVLAGLSPPGRLFSPEGYLDTQRGKTWVAATVTFSHNQPADPLNPASYYLHGLPADPLGKPYVNNEFNKQLGYEKYMQKDPRTGLYTLGHWDAKTVTAYIADMKAIRSYGGYANVFSHHQQYLTRDRDLPEAGIGPAGSQPEATPGGGEPSMHWVFQAIAEIRKSGPLCRRHDFNDALSGGLETELAGAWSFADGELRQTDTRHPFAYSRVAVEDAALEIGFEAGFLSDPGAAGRLGIQLGAASAQGPAYRLRVGKNEITLDQPGGQLPLTRILRTKNDRDRYWLAVRNGRVVVKLNGRSVIDVPDVTPVPRHNLLLFSEGAAAAFDNLRVGPTAVETFDDGDPGDWQAADPNVWKVVPETPTSSNKVWEATVGQSTVRHAYLDQVLDDFALAFDVNLAAAAFAGVRFRAAAVEALVGDGYLLRLMKEGTVTLDRLDGPTPPRELAYGWAKFDPGSVQVRIAVHGQHIRVVVDGQLVFDLDDAGLPLAPGGLALLAYGGTVRFDNLTVETGPNRSPAVAVFPTQDQPLDVGMRLEARDGDGTLDFGWLRVFVDKNDNHGFQDVSFLLESRFGIFSITRTPDDKGAVARLLRRIHVLRRERWTLRFLARDHRGNETVVDRPLFISHPE